MYTKEDFGRMVKENIKTRDVSGIMKFLEDSDFYTAPASSRFHNNISGGLVDHSVNVFNRLRRIHEVTEKYSMEEIAIVALFHDICKANFYKVSTRNVKNEKTGQWEKKPYYATYEKLPIGHGEKSVYLLMKYGVKLTDEEALAINWHMGGFDSREGYQLSNTFQNSKLALFLHLSDMMATYVDEKIYE